MNYLGLLFTASYCNGWPSIKISMDNVLLEDFKFSSTSALIPITLESTAGDHCLEIEFYGKSMSNTKLVNDVIVEDQLVTLNTIFVDNVPVPDFVKYSGIYKTHQETLPQVLCWGIPGKWTLNFRTPIIDWALDLKHKENSAMNEEQWVTLTHSPAKTEVLLTKFRELETLLSNVKI